MSEQEADPCFVMRGARRYAQRVLRELGVEDGGIADLLERDCIQRERRAVREEVGQLALEGKTDVECSEAKRRRSRSANHGEYVHEEGERQSRERSSAYNPCPWRLVELLRLPSAVKALLRGMGVPCFLVLGLDR